MSRSGLNGVGSLVDYPVEECGVDVSDVEPRRSRGKRESGRSSAPHRSSSSSEDETTRKKKHRSSKHKRHKKKSSHKKSSHSTSSKKRHRRRHDVSSGDTTDAEEELGTGKRRQEPPRTKTTNVSMSSQHMDYLRELKAKARAKRLEDCKPPPPPPVMVPHPPEPAPRVPTPPPPTPPRAAAPSSLTDLPLPQGFSSAPPKPPAVTPVLAPSKADAASCALSRIRAKRSLRYLDQNHGLTWTQGTADKFQIVQLIGEGTYGKVFKARDRSADDELVALKRLRLENEREGFPITTVREIKILNNLNHHNVVQLKEIVIDTDSGSDSSSQLTNLADVNFYLVFEYCEHDLMGLLESNLVKFSDLQIASLTKQLLLGLAHCHARHFLHRDLKCSNILLNARGQVKLADFGLSRYYQPDQDRLYTNKVITLWYRSPELLLGEEKYGPSVDLWSCGCIVAELFMKRPLFPAGNEADLFEMICKVCGVPSPAVWPAIERLPYYHRFKSSPLASQRYERKLRQLYSFLPDAALDLLDTMLVYDPKRRITAEQATNSAWLKPIQPSQIAPPHLPSNQDCHELWAKNKKRRKGTTTAAKQTNSS